jgi:NADPH:quinone reductase-like Zn-dependent oxidoreductase
MKAAFIRKHGEPDCVEFGDVPAPRPAPGEVVIAVRAAALNHLDIWVRKGGRATGLQMPHVLGSDAAGVIAEVGEGVAGVSQGDEVVLYPGLSCGSCEYCRRGQQSECTDFGIVGLSRPGTFAERVAVPAANAFPKPPHLTFEEAAALTLAHLTAWRMLMTLARILPGETVLIHGIGGGVALAGLQLAKLVGATAIVTSSSDEKLARATQMGADHVINYRKALDTAQSVRELTANRGVDIAFDTVGAATWSVDFSAIRRSGRIVLCGVTGGAQAPTNLQALYWNHFSVLGSTLGSLEECRQMLRAVAAASLKPVIDSVEELADARRAIARMEAGEQFGKIVLRLS